MKYTPPVSTEEKRFLARVADLLRRAEKSGQAVFSDFLDLREQELAKQAAGSTPTVFFGGFTGAERVMLGVNVTEGADFPIIPLDFTVYGSFDHRDVLGSVLGLGLDRAKVGDILLCDGGFRVFLADTVASFVASELSRVGRAPVKQAESGSLPVSLPRREEHTDTLASVRLDSLVAAMANLSRADATALITRGMVMVNHLPVEKPSFSPEEGDVLSLRGYGKFEIDDLGGVSRKGRVIVRYRKYL